MPLYVVPAGRSLVQIPGNIDLLSRPHVRNSDGTVSSVYSYTFTFPDGRAILVPGVIRVGGKWITSKNNAQVWRAYQQTGQFLGIFKNKSQAGRYANLLHRQQAALGGH